MSKLSNFCHFFNHETRCGFLCQFIIFTNCIGCFGILQVESLENSRWRRSSWQSSICQLSRESSFAKSFAQSRHCIGCWTFSMVFSVCQSRLIEWLCQIQSAFDLPKGEEYCGGESNSFYNQEFACWLIKSVLLRGYIFITTNHLCFYALLDSHVQVNQIYKDY